MIPIDFAFALLNGCGAMALVGVCFGQIEPLPLNTLQKQVLSGLLFGTGAAVAIYSGVQIIPGYYIDARSIFIGLAGAFAGWPAALLSTCLALLARGIKGGAGVQGAMVGLPLVACIGVVWRRWLGHRRASLPTLAGLGVGVTSTIVLWPFYLPFDQLVSLSGHAALLCITNITMAIVLGSFIQRERKLLHREQQLLREARSDALTGLPNRRAFVRSVNRMLADATPQTPVWLLAMDLDRFKDVNDRYGHAFGDEVLMSAAQLLRRNVPPGGLVARLGGEEFVMALPVSEDEARQVAQAIQRQFEQSRILFGKLPVQVTIGVGAAGWTSSTTFNAAYPRADAALYAAKRQGRNRVELLAPTSATIPVV